jgi:HEAT repeat protein
MSDGWLLEQAVAALVAIKDPKTVPQLKQILDTSNDVTWNSAAIRALGAMGAKDEAGKFLELTGDWKNPLAAPALIALGDLGELKALPKVREALASRKDEIVIAGERAAGKLLAAHPDAKADDVRDRLGALAAANDASQAVRDGALDSLGALKDPRLDKALAAAANDPGFAHTDAFLKTLKEHKIVLAE